MPRHTYFVTLGCVLAVLAAGCAGEDPDDGPADNPASQSQEPSPSPDATATTGAFLWDYTVTDSTIDGNKPGPKSRTKRTMFLSCADDDCATLYQRALADNWVGWTVRLTPTADGYTGAHTRTGDCPEAEGSFTESFTWSWTTVDGGSVEGDVLQEFTGCDLDGSTTYVGTAKPQDDEPVPYLGEPDAPALAAALTDYDATVAAVYDSFSTCTSFTEGTPRATRCFEALYRDWGPGLRQLESSVTEPLQASRGACRTVDDGLELARMADRLRAAAEGYTVQEGNAAVKLAQKQHELLTLLALLCVPPEDHTDLGDGGKLAFDIYQAVSPDAS